MTNNAIIYMREHYHRSYTEIHGKVTEVHRGTQRSHWKYREKEKLIIKNIRIGCFGKGNKKSRSGIPERLFLKST